MMIEAEHAAASAQVFLVIGTSAVVQPAANLVPYARKAGAKVIEINTEETAAASAMVDCALRGPAGDLAAAAVVIRLPGRRRGFRGRLVCPRRAKGVYH
jgi:NAD-dependent deacetylase